MAHATIVHAIHQRTAVPHRAQFDADRKYLDLDSHRETTAKRFLRGMLVWVCIGAMVAAVGFAAHTWSESVGYSRLSDAAIRQLDLYASSIENEVSKYESLPSIIELDLSVLAALDQPNDIRVLAKASKSLLNVNVRAGSLTTMLMDAKGIVVATSNWYEPDSPAGQDLSVTALFQEASRSGYARSFIAEASRGAPQYEFARAIMRRGQVLGVIAMRVSLESIESSWVEYAAGSQSEKLLVIDGNDVVIMSSNSAWRYKTVSTPTASQRESLIQGGRYASASFEPLQLTVERLLNNGSRLIYLASANLPQAQSHYIAEDQKMPRPGWRLMTLSSVSQVREDARSVSIAAAALAALVGLLGYYLLQRQRAIAQLVAARSQLQHAKDELEVRVDERTAELRNINAALVGEVAKRNQTQQTLRETQDELIQSARLALLGQMSAGISHEINQPLTALRALSDNSRQLLKIGRIDDVDRNLTSIAGLTERMGRITKQLKSFVRKGSTTVTGPVQVCTAVSNALEVLSNRIQSENVDVHVNVPEDMRVFCEGYRLEQVLLNVFSNALDAMKDSHTKQLSVQAHAQGDRVLVKISDTGTGMPEAVLSKVFEPFFSTKASGEGLGLGLVISSAIVKEYGGAMRAMNIPNGAAFEFDLRSERESPHVK